MSTRHILWIHQTYATTRSKCTILQNRTGPGITIQIRHDGDGGILHAAPILEIHVYIGSTGCKNTLIAAEIKVILQIVSGVSHTCPSRGCKRSRHGHRSQQRTAKREIEMQFHGI